MTIICTCGAILEDDMEECEGCLNERYYEEQERRARERKEELLLGVGQADYDRMVVGLLVHPRTDR